MRLAIVVVYLVKDGDGPLLDLHLSRIGRHTGVPYTIYAAVDRLASRFVAVLEREPNVSVCRFGQVADRGAREHSHYLTLLVSRALADGATHVAHLHVDSFPVRDGWATELVAGLGADCALAGAAVTEVGEHSRPRTFGIVAPREFYEEYGPIVSVDRLPEDDPAYRSYRRQWPGLDSADPYGYLLQKHDLPWRRLTRSNAREDHYLLGGIYDDLIFHLGSAARETPRLPPRHPTDKQVRRLNLLRRIGRRLAPTGLRPYIPDRLRKLWNPDGSDPEANLRVFREIRVRLLADPDAYLAYLRGRG